MKLVPIALGAVAIVSSIGCSSFIGAGDREWGESSGGAGGADSINPTITGDNMSTGGIVVSGSAGAAGTATGGGFGGGGPVGSYDKPVTVASSPPAPISGGTLTVVAQGHLAAVADSDRDQVVLVDLDQMRVSNTIALDKGDEPGRVVEDGAGHLHVVLRGKGLIATLDPAGTVLNRQPVCPHPRGLAYVASSDVIHVACAGGELVTLPAAGGEPLRQLKLARDLRDIVIDGDRLLVSRFRAAELLVVESDGHVSGILSPQPKVFVDGAFSPAVAWRTIPAPGGGALMVLQEEKVGEIVIMPGGYGGRCGGIVRSAVSILRADGTSWTSDALPAALPVDIATAPDGSRTVVAGAAVSMGVGPIPLAPVVEVDMSKAPMTSSGGDAGATGAGIGSSNPCLGGGVPGPFSSTDGPAVAVAFDASGRLLVQTRQPALWIGTHRVPLPGDPIEDTGHEIFHLSTIAGLACASCHPEGHEDGHIWTFSGLGSRRTQSINGGILGTEPFHWGGDMNSFDTLAHQVFNTRMVGPSLQSGHIVALANWVNAIPAWKPTVPQDAAAAERGRALFADSTVGCSGCHAGAKMTNNTTVDVGTGAAFQVPSLLGVGFRSPFMHAGCAPTLDDRFGACGGGDQHGHTSSLTAAQRQDLVAYLETL